MEYNNMTEDDIPNMLQKVGDNILNEHDSLIDNGFIKVESFQ